MGRPFRNAERVFSCVFDPPLRLKLMQLATYCMSCELKASYGVMVRALVSFAPTGRELAEIVRERQELESKLGLVDGRKPDGKKSSPGERPLSIILGHKIRVALRERVNECIELGVDRVSVGLLVRALVQKTEPSLDFVGMVREQETAEKAASRGNRRKS